MQVSLKLAFDPAGIADVPDFAYVRVHLLDADGDSQTVNLTGNETPKAWELLVTANSGKGLSSAEFHNRERKIIGSVAEGAFDTSLAGPQPLGLPGLTMEVAP